MYYNFILKKENARSFSMLSIEDGRKGSSLLVLVRNGGARGVVYVGDTTRLKMIHLFLIFPYHVLTMLEIDSMNEYLFCILILYLENVSYQLYVGFFMFSSSKGIIKSWNTSEKYACVVISVMFPFFLIFILLCLLVNPVQICWRWDWRRL